MFLRTETSNLNYSLLTASRLIDDVQFGFTLGRSTTYAVSIVRQLRENFHAINQTLHMPLSIWERHSIVYPDVSSGGLFASVALRSGWCDRVWQRMYDNARSKVRVGCNLTEEFSVKVSVHQGSCLPPYCSSRFWNRKICLQMTWSSSPNRWRNCKRSWSPGRLTWKESDYK